MSEGFGFTMPAVELYDFLEDPHENTNLAKSPDVVARNGRTKAAAPGDAPAKAKRKAKEK
jgi:hypothetical protein